LDKYYLIAGLEPPMCVNSTTDSSKTIFLWKEMTEDHRRCHLGTCIWDRGCSVTQFISNYLSL